MKLSSVLALTAAVVGIAACAAGSPDEAQSENTGSTQQAMCLNYPNCLPKTRNWGGLTSSSGDLVVLDPVTTTSSSSSSGSTSGGLQSGQTFQCDGKASACLDVDNHYLSCNDDRTSCVCMSGCGGGGWPYGTYNPCMYGLTYTCISYTCRCS